MIDDEVSIMEETKYNKPKESQVDLSLCRYCQIKVPGGKVFEHETMCD